MTEPFLETGLRGHTATVLTPWGRETYQVWLDRTPLGWMARIVTLPSRIWARSGGREALKFYGSTAQEAEAAAVRFIGEECVATGRRPAPPTAKPTAKGFLDLGLRAGNGSSLAESGSPIRPSTRYARKFLVRFGTRVLKQPGVTGNVSDQGLFIITDKPAPKGAPVLIDLRFPQGPVLLEGQVIWVRDQRVENRQLGFGVHLTRHYSEYVKRLREW